MEGKKDSADSSLDVKRIKLLIAEGFHALPFDKKCTNAVLVIGDTGVGKSTILSYLSNAKLIVKNNGVNTVLDVEDKNHALKIGHERYSETRIPSKMIINGTAYFDCSGFKDNRGDEYEISNSFFLQRLFKIYAKVKILLVIDEHYISEARIDKLPKLIKNLAASFGDLKSIQEGVVLLINRAKAAYTQKDYCHEIQKMAQLKTEKYIFSDLEKQFLGYLTNNGKVCLFKQPDSAQNGKIYECKDNKILQSLAESKFVGVKTIKNIISESTKLSIREYLDELTANSQAKFDIFAKKVVKDCLVSDSTLIKGLKQFRAKQEFITKVKDYIKSSSSENLCELLTDNIPSINFDEIEKDMEAISFFKEIYDKTGNYFTILKHRLVAQFTEAISSLKKDIEILQTQQDEIEKLRKQCEQQKNHERELTLKLQVFQETMKKQASEGKDAEKDFKKKEAFYLNEINAVKEESQKKISEALQQLNSIKNDGSKKLNDLEKEKSILAAEKSKQQAEIDKLMKDLEKLTISSKEKSEELELMKMENESLKDQIEHYSHIEMSDGKSVAPSMMSLASKTSKYPEVHCPHFKNGGKCKHCIKAWKDSKKQKKEDKAFSESNDFDFE